ncbi:MAG: ATP-binding protein [Gammaproteobacteria bacterium]
MKYKICHTKNVARLAEAGDALISRQPGMPGMGLLSGPTGYGKTVSVAWYAIQCRGVFVRAMANWSPSAMLSSILRELDVEMNGTNADKTTRIIELLAQHQRPVFIDEADYLVRSQMMMETLRDLHDLSNVPVILVGEEHMHRKLQGYTRLTRRLAQHVEFTGADIEDARILADQLSEVTIADDLLGDLHYAACAKKRGSNEAIGGASAGLIVVGLSRIEQLARNKGIKTVAAKDWPRGASFFEGAAPMPGPAGDVVKLRSGK